MLVLLALYGTSRSTPSQDSHQSRVKGLYVERLLGSLVWCLAFLGILGEVRYFYFLLYD